MEVATAFVATVAEVLLQPVLARVLAPVEDEYNHFKAVPSEIRFLTRELALMEGALENLSDKEEGLDVQRKVWMNELRKLSYNLEDLIDDSMKRLDDKHTKPDGFIEKIKHSLEKIKSRRQIGNEIKDLKNQIMELSKMNERNNSHEAFSNIKSVTVDLRALAIPKHSSKLVGMDGPKADIIKMLTEEDGVASTQSQQMKMLSIVGPAGMGKTTLANQVYQDLKGKFECQAFVTVSRNPDMMQILGNILSEVANKDYDHTVGSIQELLSYISNFLVDKRYLIVIDDIWDEDTWNCIKYAFSSENNFGSLIITTTRIVSVSKACCLSVDDSIYQMEPLSDDDSKNLLYKIVSPPESGCPHELEQVSQDILKKCRGLPLAIDTIASLLIGMKTKDDWYALIKTTGYGLEENVIWEKMQMILSLSYYGLPRFLKTCLLYLSTLPATQPIEKDRLVKKLIAEGIVNKERKLIQSSNKKEAKLTEELSLEEVASQYLDEFVNTNVIHPLEYNNNGQVITYNIHPMMHDALKAIAIKEKFAASLDDKEISRPDFVDIRHLSIDCQDSESLTKTVFVGGVRSLTVFGHANQLLLRQFQHVRILDLEGCKSIEKTDLEYICSMVLLKQLCLAKTQITELPPQIGKLQYLEGLDVGGTQITQLPTQIVKLKHLKTLDARNSQVKEISDQVVRLIRLVHLLIGDTESCEGVKLPDGIGKMTSLQQLCTIDLTKCSVSSLKELGELPDLKYIAVVSSGEPEHTRKNNALLSSLEKSTKLRSLVVYSDFRLSTLQSSLLYSLNCQKKLTVVKRSLKVPTGIADCSLCMLDIRVSKLEEDDLKILREVPRLQSLIVRLEVLPRTMIRISCDGFPKLESLYVDCRMPRLLFEEGAMRKLEHLELKLYAGSASEEHMGINHLLNLQTVTLRYAKWYATNKGVRETTEAMKTECMEHQNQITLYVAEEEKNSIWNTKTAEVFQENRVASSSKMTEIVKEEEDTQEGGLHQSSCTTASCNGISEIEEVVE